MIPKYINDWLEIIENMNTDNTYKLAWGRALIECITLGHCYEDNAKVIIEFDEISKCMMKYYWNQLFFFKLKQAPYKDKLPVICKDVNMLIDAYKNKNKTTIPIWFNEDEMLKLDNDLYNKMIKHISKTLHENVSWRFKNVSNKVLEIYEYDKANSRIIFDYDDALLIKNEEYGIILSKLLNYKWTQLLEKFNFQPRIAAKVVGISDNKLKYNRSQLTKYKEELLKQYNGVPIDFYTGKIIDKNDISVDHVLPWSFMYSDDIWNLVLTTKSYNSSKSNSIPDKKIIEKLEARNKILINYVSDVYKKDIIEAIGGNYLEKYYFECRL